MKAFVYLLLLVVLVGYDSGGDPTNETPVPIPTADYFPLETRRTRVYEFTQTFDVNDTPSTRRKIKGELTLTLLNVVESKDSTHFILRKHLVAADTTIRETKWTGSSYHRDTTIVAINQTIDDMGNIRNGKLSLGSLTAWTNCGPYDFNLARYYPESRGEIVHVDSIFATGFRGSRWQAEAVLVRDQGIQSLQWDCGYPAHGDRSWLSISLKQ